MANAADTVISDVKTNFTHLKDDAKQLASSVKDAANKQVASTRDKMVDLSAEAADRASTALSALEDEVHARPARSLGIALGAGIVLGLVLARR